MARGCAERRASDQRRLIELEQRLIRSQRAVSIDFHQYAWETDAQGKGIFNAVGAREVTASVMVWLGVGAIVIVRIPLVTVIGFAMGHTLVIFAM